MSDETGTLRSRIEYAELLVAEALARDSRSKSAKRVRKALLLTALRELQVEMQARRSA